MLLLQEFDFEVVTKPGKSHVLADHFSRLLTDDVEAGVYDELRDAFLFLVNASLPWYADLANFLSTATYPAGATKHEKKKLLLQARHYTLLGGYLYRYFPRESIYRRCVREDEVSIVL